jgi:hypothetical protein
MSVRENSSFAPAGLNHFPPLPTACAVGCILAPLCGWILVRFAPRSSPKSSSHGYTEAHVVCSLNGTAKAMPYPESIYEIASCYLALA